MRISDWSSDVCSSDLTKDTLELGSRLPARSESAEEARDIRAQRVARIAAFHCDQRRPAARGDVGREQAIVRRLDPEPGDRIAGPGIGAITRSEEHTSELQSLMRISYAVFCLKKKKKQQHIIWHIKKSMVIN